MKNIKISKNNISSNGLKLQEFDLVISGGNKYITLMENKKLVCKRYDEASGAFKYLQNWNGREIITRIDQPDLLKEHIKSIKELGY